MKYAESIYLWLVNTEWWTWTVCPVVGAVMAWFIGPWIVSPLPYSTRIVGILVSIGSMIISKLIYLDSYREKRFWLTKVYIKIEKLF